MPTSSIDAWPIDFAARSRGCSVGSIAGGHETSIPVKLLSYPMNHYKTRSSRKIRNFVTEVQHFHKSASFQAFSGFSLEIEVFPSSNHCCFFARASMRVKNTV
jgi:hypothetical protein